MGRLLLAAAAAAAVAVHADRSSFDCPMRDLLVEFAAQTYPGATAAQLQAIADALNGDPSKTAGCQVVVNTTLLQARTASGRMKSFALPQAGGTWYADPVEGSDSNPGTLAAPFKTIGRAVAASRAAPASQNTIVLRGGTFYNGDLITLGAADSGLTFQSYPGEEAWMSRATPLTGVNWQPYNTSASGGGWVVEQNQNAVYGGSPTPGVFAINGTYSSWQQCQAMCQANYTAGGPCSIWTWHNASATGYELECWFREDGACDPVGGKRPLSHSLISSC